MTKARVHFKQPLSNRRTAMLEARDFEVIQKIGKGQFATCYKAQQKGTDKFYALKQIKMQQMDEKTRMDCEKEIGLLQKLNHEHVIRYFGYFRDNSQGEACLYIVLELADAGDLHLLLRQFKKERRLLPEKTIWKYFVQIISGSRVHAPPVHHAPRYLLTYFVAIYLFFTADIKPANVFITQRHIAKLGDLGLGRFFSQQTAQAHSIVGTPYYMSPERMNETGYNFKSDIWSIGCLLYEMAALQSPFYGVKVNLYALCQKIQRCDYPPIPSDLYSKQVSPPFVIRSCNSLAVLQLRLLVSSCICNDPNLRFAAVQVLDVAKRMFAYFFPESTLFPSVSAFLLSQSQSKQSSRS
ncbi:Serine/threonine-protein kinase Nek7 [Aphelenchoides fujianensis]|nr:Serine/threonine-protein kinase Nek7 [Aphelenchoides fujianensis]